MLRAKNKKGIIVERDGTKYSRKSSAEQKSPKLRALQACIRVKSKGETANSREEWQSMFSKFSKKCKEELKL